MPSGRGGVPFDLSGGASAHRFAARNLAVSHTASPPGLKLAGEIDVTNVVEVEQALEVHRPLGASLHIDLSELLFCDVSGIRAIVSFAETLPGDRRLLLHGLPAQIEKVMNVVGWSEMAGLEFCTCGRRA
jgi:anti-anti-sigma regulatory factor